MVCSARLTGEYIWSQIEPAAAILCGCLVTYRPLFANFDFSFPKRLSSLFSRSSSSSIRSDEEKLTGDSDSERDYEYRWSSARRFVGRTLDYQGLAEKTQVPKGAHIINVGATIRHGASDRMTTTCMGPPREGRGWSRGRREKNERPYPDHCVGGITVTRENSMVLNPWA